VGVEFWVCPLIDCRRRRRPYNSYAICGQGS